MEIVRVTTANLDRVLPLVAAYQRFYQAEDVDDARNRRFFSQFLGSSDRGVQHLLMLDGRPAGFSTLYFCFSSVSAMRVALLNDLFVLPEHRGLGYGRALLSHAADYAKAMGIDRLQWTTAVDNTTAQRLYDQTGAGKSGWYHYTLKT